MCRGAFDDCLVVVPPVLLAAPVTLFWCHTCMSLWVQVDDDPQPVFDPGERARPGWEAVYEQANALLSDWTEEYALMPSYIHEEESQREVPEGKALWEEALSEDETFDALREEEYDRMREQDIKDYYGYSVGPSGQIWGY